MRKVARIPIILIPIFLESCTTIYFSEPQPQAVAVLKSFPADLQGGYVAEEDDTLFITSSEYRYPEEFEKHIPLLDLDSFPEIKLAGDKLFDSSLPENRGIHFTISNDTLHYSTTLYISKQLSDSLVLKKLGKWIIMSEKEPGKAYWNVYLLEKGKGGDLIAYTTKNLEGDDEDPESTREYDGKLSDFYSITPFVKIGESEYLVNPSKREFKRLIKKGFFKETAVFSKVQ